MNADVYGFLGLCKKAGKLVSGETAVLGSITSGEAHLVIIAADASDNTRKRFQDKCKTYQIDSVTFGTLEEMGRATGKAKRAACAVTDQGMAKAVLERIEVWQRSE